MLIHLVNVHQLLALLARLKGCAAGGHPVIRLTKHAHFRKPAQRQQQTYQHHRQRIKHEGHRLKVIREPQAEVGDQAHAEGRPAGKGHRHAQAACHNVGLHRQVLPGQTVFIGDIPQADGGSQGIQILVHEHDHRQQPRQQQRFAGRVGRLRQQIPEAHKPAGGLKQRDHSAKAQNTAQCKLIGTVTQRSIHGVDQPGKKALTMDQQHGQQSGQDHCIRHFSGL